MVSSFAFVVIKGLSLIKIISARNQDIITERNPIPQLKLGYEKKTTPGRRKLMRHEPESKKRKLIQEESGVGN
jgi:hypothetical protein